MKFQRILLAVASLFISVHWCNADRFINLGLTNMLDGGSIRARPGWYFQEIIQYYNTHNFLDGFGNPIEGVPSPTFNTLGFFNQGLYESQCRIFNGRLGFQAYVPFFLYANLKKNDVGITNSGIGLSDAGAGMFLQWDPFFYRGRAIFVSRLSFDVGFPTGKNKAPEKTENPGGGGFFVNPYWSVSLYPAERISLSWRLFYLWSGINKRSKIKQGDVFHMNFDVAVEPYKNLWLGCVGYYLQQYQDSTLCGKKIPNSRERVLAVGPGILYRCPEDLDLFGFVYFEKLARNRSEGIKMIVRIIKHF